MGVMFGAGSKQAIGKIAEQMAKQVAKSYHKRLLLKVLCIPW